MKSILFVEDEEYVVKSLEESLSESGYTTHVANNGQEALEMLSDTHFDIVISDVMMPDMDGVDFLETVKNDHPSTLRLALSGYSESTKIPKALEDNVAKLYMRKSWDSSEMIQTVNKMSDLQDVLSDHRILKLITSIKDLPSIPNLYYDIASMIRQEKDIEKIAAEIMKDQAVTSQILRVANSAFYGAKTGSLLQAIMYIGLSNVKNIVLTNSVFDLETVQNFNVSLLWEHAVMTNKMAHLIYEECLGKKMPVIYASAGLLHDIGKILMYKYYDVKYEELIEEARNGHGRIVDLEFKHLELTHQELGGYLLNWWDLPLPIVEATLYHHRPLDPRVINKELVSVIHIANYCSWHYFERQEYENMMNPEVFDVLGIQEEDVMRVCEKYKDREVT